MLITLVIIHNFVHKFLSKQVTHEKGANSHPVWA